MSISTNDLPSTQDSTINKIRHEAVKQANTALGLSGQGQSDGLNMLYQASMIACGVEFPPGVAQIHDVSMRLDTNGYMQGVGLGAKSMKWYYSDDGTTFIELNDGSRVKGTETPRITFTPVIAGDRGGRQYQLRCWDGANQTGNRFDSNVWIVED